MDGFEKRKDKKKDSIRRAALELFQSYGFRKVSVSEIARKAGVSQVTIYNYFGSKEVLVRDVMKWFIEGLLDKYLLVMTTNRPFSEKLEEIVFDKSRIAGQFQGELITTYIETDPEFRGYLDSLAEQNMVPAVQAFFQEGINQGYIDPRFSIEAIMVYFDIFRRGYYSNPELVEKTTRNPEIVRELIQLMTYGLNG